MRPNQKAEAAVHGCHRPGDSAVCMRWTLARPCTLVGVRVCHLLFVVCYVLRNASPRVPVIGEINTKKKCGFIPKHSKSN